MQSVSGNSEWFKTWFDSPYYHQLYKDRNDEEAQILLRNLLAKIKPKKGAKILDLACGRGRHSRFLNSLGFDVTGTDLSNASIEWARQFENETLHFLVKDMRDEIDGLNFSCIFNLFTSFGYFNNSNDNSKVLKAAHSMLKDEGCFVIDFLNVSKIISNLVKTEVKKVDGLQFTINRRVENGIIVKEISFADRGSNFQFTEQVQAFKLSEFENMLDAAGFTIKSTFGNYKMEAFDEEKSDRLIIISKKKVG